MLAWLDAQAVETLYLSATSVAELRFGIAVLPSGKRRNVLGDRLERILLPLFAARVLAFDLAATKPYAELMACARAAGKVVGHADGQIAAIVIAHGLMVASRDTAPFDAAGLEVINPWTVRP